MASPRYTIAIEKNGNVFKVCKVWFGTDGSYYVTAPYHPERTAFLLKATVNYSKRLQEVKFDQALQRAEFDDDDRTLKLAHHPDGFVHYSGEGVISGKDAAGLPKGMGVESWPLTGPVLGPAFAISIGGIENFPVVTALDNDAQLFRWDDMFPHTDDGLLMVEGFYFIEPWRRFIRLAANGRQRTIDVVHPCKAVMSLRVLLPPRGCDLGGFLGIDAFAFPLEATQSNNTTMFTMASPTGNLRENLERELVADGMYCMYPKGERYVDQTLRYIVPDLSDSPGGRGDG